MICVICVVLGTHTHHYEKPVGYVRLKLTMAPVKVKVDEDKAKKKKKKKKESAEKREEEDEEVKDDPQIPIKALKDVKYRLIVNVYQCKHIPGSPNTRALINKPSI